MKKYNRLVFFYIILIVLTTSSCAKRNLTYLSDLAPDEIYKVNIEDEKVLIQSGDLLRISVSSLQPELNVLFNEPGSELDFNRRTLLNINENGFLVDESGDVNLPALGKIKVSGLTKPEAIAIIEKGLTELVVNPIVTLRFANFKVTVIGEVNNPSTFYIPSENLNVLEALGLAGDMTEYGIRENVILIREENGVRSVNRINFNDKDLLSSPYFKLKQNDLIYIQPDKLKAVKASTNERNYVFVGMAVSILVPILFNWQNIFQR